MENGDALYARIDDEDSEEEEEVLEDLTCAQLKTRLRAINKPVGGRKADLIQRIRDHEEQMEALFEEGTCHNCHLNLEENSKQVVSNPILISGVLITFCRCDVCNLPLCDHCRATDDENEVVDKSICQDCYDKEDPDRCVKCDRTFDQRKLLNDYDCAWAWDLHCDIGDDEGDLCCACLMKWEDERCSMCNSGEHFVPKEMMWPNHTDCVFCAEPEEYAKEKNISTEEAERISKDIVANSPNGWEY
jgi:hypothetical protein